MKCKHTSIQNDNTITHLDCPYVNTSGMSKDKNCNDCEFKNKPVSALDYITNLFG